jgi:hypothetical protein
MMTILRTLGLSAFAATLAVLAVPAHATPAGEPAARGTTALAGQPGGERPQQGPHARRVELPFPLDGATPRQASPAPNPRRATPHPFRDTDLKRAALDGALQPWLSRPAQLG